MDRELGGPLIIQQAALSFEAPSVAGEFAVRANHTMTWNQEGERIRPVRPAHCSRAARLSKSARYLTVGASRARRNRAQLTPYSQLERRHADIERKVE